MLNPKPQQECSESTSEPLLNGSRKGKSKQLKPRQGKGDTTLNPTQGNRLTSEISFQFYLTFFQQSAWMELVSSDQSWKKLWRKALRK
jgi:hypothetical protein